MECQRTNEETELTIIAIISIQIQTVKEFTVLPIDVELHVRLHIQLGQPSVNPPRLVLEVGGTST